MLDAARRVIPVAVLAALGLTACNSSDSAHAQSDNPQVTITGLYVLPSTAGALQLPVGHQHQFTAIATFSNDTTADVTAAVTWTSSNDAAASVTGGVVTGVAAGDAQISATEPTSGSTASVAVSVTATELVLLDVSPVDPTILIGTTLPLVAWGTLNDDSSADFTSYVNWTSSDASVASVSPSGVVTAMKLGSATITATDPISGVSDSTIVTVTDVPAALAYLYFSRGSVVGGSSVEITGTVVLTSYATDPVLVNLRSGDSTLLEVPDSVTVDPLTDRASFWVTHHAVDRRTRVYVYADDGKSTKKAKIMLRATR